MVTTMGVLRFNNETKRAYLSSYHPGLTPEIVAQNTGFQLDTSQAVETGNPTAEEIRILREIVDPEEVFLKRYAESG